MYAACSRPHLCSAYCAAGRRGRRRQRRGRHTVAAVRGRPAWHAAVRLRRGGGGCQHTQGARALLHAGPAGGIGSWHHGAAAASWLSVDTLCWSRCPLAAQLCGAAAGPAAGAAGGVAAGAAAGGGVCSRAHPGAAADRGKPARCALRCAVRCAAPAGAEAQLHACRHRGAFFWVSMAACVSACLPACLPGSPHMCISASCVTPQCSCRAPAGWGGVPCLPAGCSAGRQAGLAPSCGDHHVSWLPRSLFS